MGQHSAFLRILEQAEKNAFKEMNFSERFNFLNQFEFENKKYCHDEADILEYLTRQILVDDIEPETPALLLGLATMTADLVSKPDSQWIHSVCHNFEQYRTGHPGDLAVKDDSSSQERPTFLRDPRFFPAAEVIVDKAAVDPGMKNFQRIVDPIVQYNIDQMVLRGVQDCFAWKPASLSLTNIPSIGSDKHYQRRRAFMENDTPCVSGRPEPDGRSLSRYEIADPDR
jgi:hypothetical protein